MPSIAVNSRILRWIDQAHQSDETKRSSAKRFRIGKTKRDRERGMANKAAENRMIRVSWQHDTKGSPFPWHTCNGKKNRNEWTGKGGQRVIRSNPK